MLAVRILLAILALFNFSIYFVPVATSPISPSSLSPASTRQSLPKEPLNQKAKIERAESSGKVVYSQLLKRLKPFYCASNGGSCRPDDSKMVREMTVLNKNDPKFKGWCEKLLRSKSQFCHSLQKAKSKNRSSSGSDQGQGGTGETGDVWSINTENRLVPNRRGSKIINTAIEGTSRQHPDSLMHVTMKKITSVRTIYAAFISCDMGTFGLHNMPSAEKKKSEEISSVFARMWIETCPEASQLQSIIVPSYIKGFDNSWDVIDSVASDSKASDGWRRPPSTFESFEDDGKFYPLIGNTLGTIAVGILRHIPKSLQYKNIDTVKTQSDDKFHYMVFILDGAVVLGNEFLDRQYSALMRGRQAENRTGK